MKKLIIYLFVVIGVLGTSFNTAYAEGESVGNTSAEVTNTTVETTDTHGVVMTNEFSTEVVKYESSLYIEPNFHGTTCPGTILPSEVKNPTEQVECNVKYEIEDQYLNQFYDFAKSSQLDVYAQATLMTLPEEFDTLTYTRVDGETVTVETDGTSFVVYTIYSATEDTISHVDHMTNVYIQAYNPNDAAASNLYPISNSIVEFNDFEQEFTLDFSIKSYSNEYTIEYTHLFHDAFGSHGELKVEVAPIYGSMQELIKNYWWMPVIFFGSIAILWAIFKYSVPRKDEGNL